MKKTGLKVYSMNVAHDLDIAFTMFLNEVAGVPKILMYNLYDLSNVFKDGVIKIDIDGEVYLEESTDIFNKVLANFCDILPEKNIGQIDLMIMALRYSLAMLDAFNKRGGRSTAKQLKKLRNHFIKLKNRKYHFIGKQIVDPFKQEILKMKLNDIKNINDSNKGIVNVKSILGDVDAELYNEHRMYRERLKEIYEILP